MKPSKISLLFGDWQLLESLTEEMEMEFPGLSIVGFSNVANFLLTIPTLTPSDVIITNNALPLCDVGVDTRELKKTPGPLFVDGKWNGFRAGERLIRHLREQNINLLIILYAISEVAPVDNSVVNDPQVKYRPLGGNTNLARIIRSH